MMQPVRALGLLILAAGLAGCSGFSIGVREDKADRAAFIEAVTGRKPGSGLQAHELLAKDWERLWIFRGGGSTQAVEDRIGIPFPQSAEKIPVGAAYLVWDDGSEVISAFSVAGLDPRCLRTEVPYGRRSRLAVTGPGGRVTGLSDPARCR